MSATKSILSILACAVLALCFGLYLTSRDHDDSCTKRKGKVASVGLSDPRSEQLFTRHRLSLVSSSGLKVEAGLLVPKQELPSRRYPAVVLLAGLETGSRAVDYIAEVPDAVIAALDYPYHGGNLNSAAQVGAELLPLRRAALDTVPSAMLLIDYLASRTDVDSSKIVLVGLSLGAIFVPCLTAEDRRPDAAVMVFGGGDLRRILKQNLGGFCGKVESEVLSYAGALLLRPIEPMRYADRIAPVPLLMINGTKDDMIPRRCTVQFFKKARPPKKLIWLDEHHIMPEDVELTRKIIEVLRTELGAMKLLP